MKANKSWEWFIEEGGGEITGFGCRWLALEINAIKENLERMLLRILNQKGMML